MHLETGQDNRGCIITRNTKGQQNDNRTTDCCIICCFRCNDAINHTCPKLLRIFRRFFRIRVCHQVTYITAKPWKDTDDQSDQGTRNCGLQMEEELLYRNTKAFDFLLYHIGFQCGAAISFSQNILLILCSHHDLRYRKQTNQNRH